MADTLEFDTSNIGASRVRAVKQMYIADVTVIVSVFKPNPMCIIAICSV